MDRIAIGKVVSVNFPRRELRLTPLTGHPERFERLDTLHLVRKDGSSLQLDIDHVRPAGRKICVGVAESESSDVLDTVRGAVVVVSEQDRFELPENEYYHDELIGLDVCDPAGRTIGRVTAVYPFDHHDVFEVTADDGGEYLVAAVKPAVLDIDPAAGRIVVEPTELVRQDSNAD